MRWVFRLMMLAGFTGGIVRLVRTRALHHLLLVFLFAFGWVFVDTKLLSKAPAGASWAGVAMIFGAMILYEYLERRREPGRWRGQPSLLAKWALFLALMAGYVLIVLILPRRLRYVAVIGVIIVAAVVNYIRTRRKELGGVASIGVLLVGLCLMIFAIPSSWHAMTAFLTLVAGLAAAVLAHKKEATKANE
jgi:FtsH-binding integral membrane protein